MLNPSGRTSDIPQSSFENLIEGPGYIHLSFLEMLIPITAKNEWTAEPTDRIQNGFKYKFGNYIVHGHQRDSAAPKHSVAKNNWVVRIKYKNKYLLSETQQPPTGGPVNWSSNASYANYTHIPAAGNRFSGFSM